MKRFFLHLTSLVLCLVPTVALAHSGAGLHVHGAEMEAAGAGLLAATALLLGIGVLVGLVSRGLGKKS